MSLKRYFSFKTDCSKEFWLETPEETHRWDESIIISLKEILRLGVTDTVQVSDQRCLPVNVALNI
jgi:hypothetical protein